MGEGGRNAEEREKWEIERAVPFLPVAVTTLVQVLTAVFPGLTHEPHRNNGVSLRMLELFSRNPGTTKGIFLEEVY